MSNICLYLFCTTCFIFAQNINVNDRQYIQIDGNWYQSESWGDYRLDDSIVTVKFKTKVNPTTIQNFFDSQNFEIVRRNIKGFYDVKIPPGNNPIEVVNALYLIEIVEYAEPNTIGGFSSNPDDDYFSNQWYHNNTGEVTWDNDIDTPNAWDIETGNSSVIVSIIDRGTDIFHEDLIDNIWVNPGEDIDEDNVVWDTDDMNGIDDDGNGLIDDLVGWNYSNNDSDVTSGSDHGTFVAGVLGAATNNNIGIAGVTGGWDNQGVSMMIIKWPGGCATLDDAIEYSAKMGAKIISTSVHCGGSAAIDSMIEFAYVDSGCFIVAAAGNHNLNQILYPANTAYVYGVGATDECDHRAEPNECESSMGSNYGDSLDIVAPGIGIYSTENNDTYGYNSGTSYSTPMVAGIAALLLSYNSTYTNYDIAEIISRSAEKVGNYDYNISKEFGLWNNEMGYGRINAFYAVAPPSAPTGLSISGSVGQHPTISWNSNPEPDIKAYKVYRKRVGVDSGYIPIATVNTPNTSYTDNGITIYSGRFSAYVYYKIKAEDYSNQLSLNFSDWVRTKYRNQVEQKILSDIQIPVDFALHIAIPNPFNPTASIRYDLPEESIVILKIYDLTGREVITLINKDVNAGFKNVMWDSKDNYGRSISSGMYFYRLDAFSKETDKEFHETRKMVLLR